MILTYVFAVIAVIAVFEAFRKHRTFAGVKASVLREVAYLESLASKGKTTAKADLSRAVARLKSIF